MRGHPRSPRNVTAVLLVVALSATACGGGDGDADSKVAADAPRATRTPRPITIVVDKKPTEVTTAAATVREVLTEANIELGPYDLVKPPADQPAADQIKIVRLLTKPVLQRVKIPAGTVKKKNSKLTAWSTKVLRPGRPGIKLVKSAYVKRRGKKVKVVLAQKIKRKPVTQIVAVGPQPGSAGGSVANLNWAGLAKCESGGRPNAVNPAGYYGLYQFSLQTWGSVGGTGLPSNATPAEQTYRAQMLYNKVQGRWQGQWPNCGKFLF